MTSSSIFEPPAPADRPPDQTFAVGCYTTTLPHVAGRGTGIEWFRFRIEEGAVDHVGSSPGVDVSFLTEHRPSGTLLAVEERIAYAGADAGTLAMYAPGPGSSYRLVDRCSTRGAGPVGVAVDSESGLALVANYYGGSIVAIDVGAEHVGPVRQIVTRTGSSVDPERQTRPHPHAVHLHPNSDLMIVPDLGTDELVIYRLDRTRQEPIVSTGIAVASAPGAGPRHIAPHPDGDHLFVVNELDSTVSAYRVVPDRSPPMIHLHTTATLPPGAKAANNAGEVAVHPSGRFVYVSNRGHDSISELEWDPDRAALSLVGSFLSGGRTPRHFALDPTGRFMVIANQASDSLRLASVDATGGCRLVADVAPVGTPAYVKWGPLDRT